VILALALVVASTQEGCARAQEILASPVVDAATLDTLIETLPNEAVQVKVQARMLSSSAGIARSTEVMAGAVGDGCRAVDVDAASARSDVDSIMKSDARFGGVRKGDDLFDRIKHKIGLWLAHLFESSGMRAYAASARIVYLSGLAIVASFIAVRVVRTLLRSRKRDEQARVQAAVERERLRKFTSWRADASSALQSGDARGALRAGRAAILARVGEVERDVVTPARTHREIVARLAAQNTNVANVVTTPLASFDVAWFGKDATLDDASAFLRAVDDAASLLSAPATKSAEPRP
jgi:hypothetical protein